jgi:membrane protease YdiL (CAAX protease family)
MRQDRVLSLIALALAAVQPVAPLGTPRAVYLVAALASVIVAVAARRASAPVRGLTAMLGCLVAALQVPLPSFVAVFAWQVTMLLALPAFAIAGRFVADVRPSPAWRAPGRIAWGWTAVVGGVTPVALVSWLLVMRPDLHNVGATVPDFPLPVLLAGGALFAVVNAILEEAIWRGVLFDRLLPVFGVPAALALQGLSFGLQHAHGVPRGPVGVVLAGSWGVMLGMLRRKTGGMLAPIVAHVVADTTIAAIVLFYVR